MRIHLISTENKEIVPFDYQQKLVGTLHKWLGENNHEHGEISLYSFSWLQGGQLRDKGFDFPNGAKWFISFHDEEKIKMIIKSIINDKKIFCGMYISDLIIEETPDLSAKELYYLGSPILIKRYLESECREKHYSYEDKISNELMKQTLLHKMRVAGLVPDETLNIQFDLSYLYKKQKLMTYNGVKNKANLCPIRIIGKPETKAFAWDSGIGNCTGIGFGAIY